MPVPVSKRRTQPTPQTEARVPPQKAATPASTPAVAGWSPPAAAVAKTTRVADLGKLGDSVTELIKNWGPADSKTTAAVDRFMAALSDPNAMKGLKGTDDARVGAVLVQITESMPASEQARWRGERLPAAMKGLLERPDASRKLLFQSSILREHLSPERLAPLLPLMHAIRDRTTPQS